MHKRKLTKKVKVFIITISVVLITAIPVTTYAYNRINYNKYFDEGNKLLQQDKLEEAENAFKTAGNFNKKENNKVQEKLDFTEVLKQSKTEYDKAVSLMNEKKFIEAIEVFNKVSKEDNARYELASNNIKDCSKRFVEEKIETSKQIAENKNFSEAIILLDTVIGFDAANNEAIKLKSQYNEEIEKIKAEEKRIAEEKAKQEEKARQEAAKNISSNVKSTQKNTQSEPTIVGTYAQSMVIDDNGTKINVQFLLRRDFYSMVFGIITMQGNSGTPNLPSTIELDYTATFKYSTGEKVYKGKTVSRPIANKYIEVPYNEEIKVKIDVVYKQKTYSFNSYFQPQYVR